MTDMQLDTKLMSKLSTVHQKSEGGLCKTPLALQRGRYSTSKCSSLMIGDCVLSLGIKPLTSQKTCGRPAGDKDSKKHKIYRTANIYRRAVAWIEGSRLVTPQNLVCYLTPDKTVRMRNWCQVGCVGGNEALPWESQAGKGQQRAKQREWRQRQQALLGNGTPGSLCPVITILTLDRCLSTGAYSSACVKCYKLKFSILGLDFRLLALSKRKFQLKQVSYLQNRN